MLSKKTVHAELVNVIQTNDSSELVRKADYKTKSEDIEKKIPNHDKYITTNDFKLSFFDEKLKQGKSATNKDLNAVEQPVIKNGEKYKNYKHDLSFSLVTFFFFWGGW